MGTWKRKWRKVFKLSRATGIHAYTDPEGYMITTMVYDDGRVVQQIGHGCDWVQIKDPDKWEPVPGEGEPEEVEDPEVKTEPGECAVCKNPYKPGELTVFNARNEKCHRFAKDCGK